MHFILFLVLLSSCLGLSPPKSSRRSVDSQPPIHNLSSPLRNQSLFKSQLSPLRNQLFSKNQSSPLRNQSLSKEQSSSHNVCAPNAKDTDTSLPPVNVTAQKIMSSIAGIEPSALNHSRTGSKLTNLTARANRAPPSGGLQPTVPRPNQDLGDHNDAWRQCWQRGHTLWNALLAAQQSPQDMVVADLTHWHGLKTCLGTNPTQEFCHQNGFLRRVSGSRNPFINLCHNTVRPVDYSFGTAEDEEFRQHGLQIDYGVYESHMILSNFIGQDVLEEWSYSSYPPDVWPDLAFRGWKSEVQEQSQRYVPGTIKITSLQYIMFGRLDQNNEVLEVIEDIWSHDPTLQARISGNTALTPIATYTPTDDNFYAMLGTQYGKGAALLLEHYVNSFATKAPDTGIIEKIKTIRDVKIAGSNLDDEDRERRDPEYDSDLEGWNEESSASASSGAQEAGDPLTQFFFNMGFTLQDVDPPPPQSSGGPAQQDSGPSREGGSAPVNQPGSPPLS